MIIDAGDKADDQSSRDGSRDVRSACPVSVESSLLRNRWSEAQRFAGGVKRFEVPITALVTAYVAT